MTHYQKGTLVMNYLADLGADWEDILDAICDENLELSFKLIQENPEITVEELLSKLPEPIKQRAEIQESISS